ncbi:MAG: PaaI family thioesterase, partial [Pseudomonadota bacterium]
MALDSLGKVQAMLDHSPFIRNSEMKAVAVDNAAETLTLQMPLKPEFERAPGSGQFHGGPIAALIDTAGC